MSEKTPVSMLQELCIRHKEGSPFYEEIADGTDEAKTFAYIVQAFDQMAQGSGRSKREAKHEAAANLLSNLKEQDRFKAELKEVPPTPRPSSENDSVSILLDTCVQRNWPIPNFRVQQACGAPHAPEFTVVCLLASIKRQGTFSTKKGAKQIAAQIMLDVVQQFDRSDDDKQVALVDKFEPEPVEKVIRTYRDLKKSDIKPVVVRFNKRHNYFARFEQDKRQLVSEILYGPHTPKDMVHLICEALKVKHSLDDVPKHPGHVKMFVLQGEYDCVIVAKEEFLWNKIVKYFKVMFNFENF